MEKQNESKKAAAQQRRNELKTLSNELEKAAKLMGDEDSTVNELLRNYYQQQGHTELKTYQQWQEEGFQVRRGEHALLLWARPKATKKSKEEAVARGLEEEEAKEDYFPVKYLFSQKQVRQVSE